VEAADKELYERNTQQRRQSGSVRWPSNLPPFTIAWPPISTQDGKLVIRRAPSARNPGTRYDVIDRQGRIERQLALPASERILAFGKSSVYVVVKDVYDLERIRRHPWR
jgi:hypothetical protein